MDQGHMQTKEVHEEHFIQSEQLPCERPNKECETAVNFLYDCYGDLKHTVLEISTPKQLADIAQSLIDSLNKKRKNDTELLAEYKLALDSHTQKMVQVMEEKVFRLHETQNDKVNENIHQLFACLDNITASQNDLDKFKASLRALYEDMHGPK